MPSNTRRSCFASEGSRTATRCSAERHRRTRASSWRLAVRRSVNGRPDRQLAQQATSGTSPTCVHWRCRRRGRRRGRDLLSRIQDSPRNDASRRYVRGRQRFASVRVDGGIRRHEILCHPAYRQLQGREGVSLLGSAARTAVRVPSKRNTTRSSAANSRPCETRKERERAKKRYGVDAALDPVAAAAAGHWQEKIFPTSCLIAAS